MSLIREKISKLQYTRDYDTARRMNELPGNDMDECGNRNIKGK